MTDERWRCTCTVADAAACRGDETLIDRNADGSCACVCHIEYSDDPENWQPLAMDTKMTNAELQEHIDWMVRMDQAEALAEDEQP